ncbi:transcription factor Ouib [Drosophila rhopaloa]|uniref:Transcription factor Ouib n=1 Tax=Drosophila rhopaloa TaxID=1041015 RepID=A0A6P4EQ82_DRORH|nr:transcription factor Ouib [Drosophila rhopaloa]XP_044314875.1 transcription factor Ouib [Drosophila rhopaloa]XP_044314876.1 transcription factor Ouib [Drosophila rhopaloa]
MTLQCRTCGGVIYNTKAKNLFDTENVTLLQNVNLVSGAMLHNDPKLPSCICACCMLDLNQAVVFRERLIQTQEDLLRRLIDPEQEEFATECEKDDVDVEVKEEEEAEDNSLNLRFSTDDMDDKFEETEEFFEEFQDVDEEEEGDNVEVGEEVSQDADSLISSVQKEFETIYDDESTTEKNEFLEEEEGTYYNECEDEVDGSPPVSPQPAFKALRSRSRANSVSSERTSKPKRKKQYVTWKNMSEDQIVERKRQQRKRDCVCEQCGRHFTDQSNFKLHMLRHTGMKNFACQECGKLFYTDHLMSLHQRIVHQGEKPYACRYCSKSFHNSTTRVIHERVHTNAKPYGCNQCDKSFSSASGRKRHELIHTGVRAFSCTICEQTFQRNTHLKAHLRSKFHILKARTNGVEGALE